MSKWYEKYELLNSSLFTWDNSGNRSGEAPPRGTKRDEDYNTTDLKEPECYEYRQKDFEPLGYTENPSFHARGYKSIGFMFLDKTNNDKIWWHYPKE